MELHGNLHNCNVENDLLRSMPNAVDHARVVELGSFLSDVNVVSKLDGTMDLDDVRVQYPSTAHYLSSDTAIVQYKNFEKGFVKLQKRYEHDLTNCCEESTSSLSEENATADGGDEEKEDGLAVAQRYDRNQTRKKARTMLILEKSTLVIPQIWSKDFSAGQNLL